MTLLCVPIIVTSLRQALADAARAGELGADLVEYRLDSFTELDAVRELIARSPLRCIATCRPAWEGGLCELTEQERIPVLEAASLTGADYIDVEWTSYTRSANLRQKVHFNAGDPIDQTAPRPDRKGMIVSAHDHAGRPPRLTAMAAKMSASGADVVKLAWMARSVRDNLEAFELLRLRVKPMVALCMGEAGLASRVLAPKFGAFLTFASLTDTSVTAPGQPTIRQLLELYRFRRIGPATAVYGVVGHPVAHSLSPHVHNHHFELRGDDAVYLPLPVPPGYESFKAFMESFARDGHLTLRGLSVTLPHKENAFRYLREVGATIDPVALASGAVNTIAIDPDGSLRGTSTDHGAILHAVELGLGQRKSGPIPLAQATVAVLGAGGTGRTAVAALVQAGATVVVYNRTLDRAEALAREFSAGSSRATGESGRATGGPGRATGGLGRPNGGLGDIPGESSRGTGESSPATGESGHARRGGRVVAAEMSLLPSCRADVVINTTSLGMHPETLASPFGPEGELAPALTPDTVCFDTVYTPMQTLFLHQAALRGAVTVPGLEMFAHQAASQYHFWTGRAPTLDAMRERVRQILAEQATPPL